jgi:hypothetical protein
MKQLCKKNSVFQFWYSKCFVFCSEAEMQAFLKGGSTKPKEKDPQSASESASVSGKEKSKRKAPQPWVEK